MGETWIIPAVSGRCERIWQAQAANPPARQTANCEATQALSMYAMCSLKLGAFNNFRELEEDIFEQICML